MERKPLNETLDYVDLFEHAPTGYALLDAFGCIKKINTTGATLLGWQAPWLEGQPLSRWVVGTDKQRFNTYLRKLSSGDRCVSVTLRVKNRQGRTMTLWLDSTAETPLPNSSETVRTVMIDVSGEQASARKLRSLQSQLTHLARLKTAGELASSLAHELNQPLGTVVLNCEAALRLLGSGPDQTAEFAEVLTQARDAATFASDVVRHLRSFLRNNGEHHTNCKFSTLIRDVSMLIEADAKDNDIELQLEIEPDMPGIRVDPVQIGQVLINLAHNSIEAMSENGGANNRVMISARQQAPDQILVSVADTGPGLDNKLIDRIFSPFYTTKSNGMGLGLSISRTIIEAHGGKLWAANGSFDGATVQFTLPTIDGEYDAD